MTGLNNQRTFEKSLAEELMRAKRNQSDLALLLAEIDNFELFARDFGAVAKDDALRCVAKVLKGQARGNDTLACLDSDAHRFAVLMPEANDAELTAVAARLHRAVASMKPVWGVRCVSALGPRWQNRSMPR